MKTKLLITIFIVALCSIACQTTTSVAIKTVDTKSFKQKLEQTEKPQLLDVRTPKEFEEGHIPGAINLNVNGNNFEAEIKKLNKNQPVFVYCRLGKRSLKAATILEKAGFTTIYNLEGGITAWEKLKK